MPHRRTTHRSALAVMAACAVLLRSPARAALSIDGFLAPLPAGGSSYAPTFPSKLLAPNGYTYVAGVVNTTLYAASNSTGQARARCARRSRLMRRRHMR
jgi:hypothetical protein